MMMERRNAHYIGRHGSPRETLKLPRRCIRCVVMKPSSVFKSSSISFALKSNFVDKKTFVFVSLFPYFPSSSLFLFGEGQDPGWDEALVVSRSSYAQAAAVEKLKTGGKKVSCGCRQKGNVEADTAVL